MEKRNGGYLTVFTGPMFSGKSGNLIEEIKKAKIANESILVFKSSKDVRDEKVVSKMHNVTFESVRVDSALEILKHVPQDVKNVAIEEAQFFGDDLIVAIKVLYNSGKNIIVAGLDLTSEGVPFGPMPELLAMADEVEKFKSVCQVCGSRYASKSYCAIVKTDDVMVVQSGKDTQVYQARCNAHWNKFPLAAGELKAIDDATGEIKGAKEDIASAGKEQPATVPLCATATQ